MIELLVYNVGGQLVLRGTPGPRTSCPGGHLVLGPRVRGTFLRGDILSCDTATSLVTQPTSLSMQKRAALQCDIMAALSQVKYKRGE